MSTYDFTFYSANIINALFDRPILPNKPPLLINPLTKHFRMQGIAIDYAIRLSLQKLNHSSVITKPFIAESAIKSDSKRLAFYRDFHTRLQSFLIGSSDIYPLLPDCIILAHLESLIRSNGLYYNSNADIFRIDQDDILDLQHMIDVFPSNKFVSHSKCELNPIFNQSSLDIGGADADLLLDNTLIDFKATKYWKIRPEDFHQLICYWWLDKRERLNRFDRLGIYFARYGYLFTFLIKDVMFINDADLVEWQTIKSLNDRLTEYQHSLRS